MARQRILTPSEPLKRTWALSAVDVALKDMFVSFAAVFGGRIDTERFTQALRQTLIRYPFFHGTLRQQEDAVLVLCHHPPRPGTREGMSAVGLDLDDVDAPFPTRDRRLLYTGDFVSRLVPGKPPVHDGRRPLLHLKLTHYRDASVVGLCWNHALTDLHGIYDFLRAISEAYSHPGRDPGAPPVFDRRDIWRQLGAPGEAARGQPSREGRHGIVHISRVKAALGIARYLKQAVTDAVPVCLFLDEDGVDAIKAQALAAGTKVSTNDVVNATLLKFFGECTRDPRAPPDVGLYFPIDVRELLGAPPGSVANCLGNASAVLRRADLWSSSVTELAMRNRAVVSAYGQTQLRDDLHWADYWRRHTSQGSVYHHWLLGRDRVYSSNWTSQELARVSFDGAAFVTLLRSSQLNTWLLLPAFHSTVLPRMEDGRMKQVVRVAVRREHFRTLARHLREWPHVQEAIRLDTGSSASAGS
ncbi:acyltransferase [Corallococcus interemptor]|uniref:acyltransferase n=1 Tax=Corallococcus interemptor TaxID=2316720 RepID=UPI0035D48FBF